MIVVDASVAAKWFLIEPGTEAAAEILASKQHLVAPALIRIEVAGAIVRRFREGHISEFRARQSAGEWEEAVESRAIRLVPDAELFNEALELAFLARHTVADCLYLALAKRLNISILTADKPMLERGSRVHGKIEFLAGMEPN